MKARPRFAGSSVALAVLIGLGGCSGMSRQDQNTAVGAGIGGVAGAVLTDGSAIGTVGVVFFDGVMANEIYTDDDRNGNRDRNRDRDRYRDRDGN